MLKNSLLYFTLCILIQLLVKIDCQMVPDLRVAHTATFIDNKLYILGGLSDEILDNGSYNVTSSFFYLDFSAAFNTKNLSWKNLSSINVVPSHSEATSVRGGAKNN